MSSRTALLCAILVLAANPLCRSQSEPRPIVEHLGMLMWADEVSNFQPQVTAANASLCSGAKGALDARNHSWTGVTCDPAGHVACINLAAQGLSGPLSSLDNLLDGHMMSLLSLDLSGNRLAGELEGAWATAYHLQELHLADQMANLTGGLPAAWGAPGAFPRLQARSGADPIRLVLNVAGNQLSGPIPGAWAGDPKAADGSAFPDLRVAALLPSNGRLCGAVPQGFPLAALRNSSAAGSGLDFAAPVAALASLLCQTPQPPAAASPAPALSKRAESAGVSSEQQLASAG